MSVSVKELKAHLTTLDENLSTNLWEISVSRSSRSGPHVQLLISGNIADAVRAEREACALACEAIMAEAREGHDMNEESGARQCRDAIRARGKSMERIK